MVHSVDGPGIANLEGHHDYDVRWPWSRGPLVAGMTVVLRVKNEARSLPFVLPGLFRAADRVVLVDNGSCDGTTEVARKVAAGLGAADRLATHDYPFEVSRCGPEHLATPEASVHSLAYFNNWSFSQAVTDYSMKWDGDMVMTEECVATVRDLAWRLRDSDLIVSMPRHPLYVEAEGRVGYLDVGMRNVEAYGFPVGPEYTFVKAFEWELRMFPERAQRVRLPEGLCVELKWLDGDEFGHWTAPDSFASSARTARKRREYDLFRALASGQEEGLDGVVRIEAPEGMHVVDYVTGQWLPQRDRPIIQRPAGRAGDSR